jgi:hypothetical protein
VPCRIVALPVAVAFLLTLVAAGRIGGVSASSLPGRALAVDVPAPFYWDDQTGTRSGGEADRFEVDDPSGAASLSAWYHLSYLPGTARLRVREHSPASTRSPDSDIGHSANVAWHVARVVLGSARGVAHAGELPEWARPRTGDADGTSAGSLFALADVDLMTGGSLAGHLRVAATGSLGSDGSVTAVRMVDAKLAAARLVPVDVVFAPQFPSGIGSVTVIASHLGRPAANRTIGDWLNTDGYEAAGRQAAGRSGIVALVSVDDIRQALAWLCGRLGRPVTCFVAHAAAAVPLSLARPYVTADAAPAATARRTGPQ